MPEELIVQGERRLAKLNIRVSNGNAVVDALKSDAVRQREGQVKANDDIEEMLEPFGTLRGVGQVSIGGAVTADFAGQLASKMKSQPDREELERMKLLERRRIMLCTGPPALCVYGNDMT